VEEGMGEEELSHLKEIINDEARKGVFDNNPLLNTTHVVTCRECKHRQDIIFLEYLKSGEFELGKVQQIEVLDTSGPIGLFELEKVTPITITCICKECGCRIEVRPVSAEYLKTIIEKPKTAGTMYM